MIPVIWCLRALAAIILATLGLTITDLTLAASTDIPPSTCAYKAVPVHTASTYDHCDCGPPTAAALNTVSAGLNAADRGPDGASASPATLYDTRTQGYDHQLLLALTDSSRGVAEATRGRTTRVVTGVAWGSCCLGFEWQGRSKSGTGGLGLGC